MKNRLLFLFFLCSSLLFGQQFSRLNVTAANNTNDLKNPFVGGLNAPQLCKADLNQDGIQDLVVFDRIGNVVLPYINHGTANTIDYSFEPTYAKNFPKLREWMVLRDFNADGAMDIFSYSDVSVDGMAVWRGFYENKTLKFSRVYFKDWAYNILPFYNNGKATNLYVTGQDYPDIVDIDADGDLDVLTFENGGGYVNWYKNIGLESGFSKDSLLFILQDHCWGKFYESGITKKLDLSATSTKCANSVVQDAETRGARHAGSTLLAFDNDGDGDMELLLGDISFNNINMVVNGGTKTNAWGTSQVNDFPEPTNPVNLEIFPASFMLDINNDGKKDYIAAPNNLNSSEDVNACWYYENIGTEKLPSFQFRKKTLLIDEMFDFGSSTAPAFADVDGDGLTDIVVGVGYAYKANNDLEGRLVLLKNIGTKTNPKFKVTDDNWLNFKQFVNNSYFFAPTFGDLDGDGDKDLIVGESSGALFYVENKGGAGKAMSFDQNTILQNYEFQGIDVGQNATPQVVDVNRDGLMDLLIGESNGTLIFFKNLGTKTSPKFDGDKKSANNILNFGKFNVAEYQGGKGNAVPHLIDFNGKYQLFVSSLQGKIFQYENIDGNLSGTFTLKNSDWGNIREGFFASLAIEDINADGILDALLGNQRGGLAFYKTNLDKNGAIIATKEIESSIENVSIFPNPTSSILNIQFENQNNSLHKIQIFNTLGQKYYSVDSLENTISIETNQWTKGVYFLIIESEKGKLIKKIICQ